MRYRICLMVMVMLASACALKPEPAPPAPRLEQTSRARGLTSAGPAGPIETHNITPPASENAAMTGSDGFVAGSTVKVGLLLPLTGRSAELGRAMQDAATVSLFDKYARLSTRQATIKVELLPKDTGDTPEQAAEAMRAAIADGAQFIIGPLFSDATEAAAPVAREKNINVLSLSNNTSRGGNGVYMFGFSPQEQAARIVQFAVDSGKQRIAALVPDSPLGMTVLDSAKATLEAKGLSLVKIVKYSPQGVGVDAAANQLVSATGAAPDFDALLLPEGGPPLGTILRALSARGISNRNVQFLGTGIWDDTALVRRVPLEGAWLASSPPADTLAFDTRFRSTYQYTAPRIASLAYDAVALAVTLGTSGRPFDQTTLTSPAGFAGPANGIFRLRPDGKVERGLAVMQVQAGTFKELSPAPGGFSQ